MSSRKNAPVSLLREACQIELRAMRYSARHAARKATRKPTRLTLAIAATAAVGAIAAASAAPWTGAVSALDAVSGNNQGSAFAADVTDASVASAQPGTASAPATQAPMTSKSMLAQLGKAKPGSAPARSGKHAAPAAAKHAAPAKPKPNGPTTIYDSVNPGAIPAGEAEAVYADGTYQASWAQTAGHRAMWIDVHGYNLGANVLDVEPGDASPAGAAAWVSAKLSHTPNANAVIYTMRSEWGAVQANVSALPSWMHSHVKYWIADPTGYSHIVPGADATQWYWGANYDITAAHPDFFSN